MVAWFILTVIILTLLRAPFMYAAVIPHFLEFNPGVVMVPLVGVFWGPAGAWGCLASSVLSDYLFDMWSPVVPFRAIGFFLFAMSAKRLWDAFPRRRTSGPLHEAKWSPAIRFTVITWPGCLIAASWPAFGAALYRYYPFTYFVSVLLLIYFFFVPLVGIVLYRAFAREIVPHFGTWKEVMIDNGAPQQLSIPGFFLLITGAIGSCVIGMILSYHLCGFSPVEPYVLGTVCHRGVLWAVGPFLLMQIIGVMWTVPVGDQG